MLTCGSLQGVGAAGTWSYSSTSTQEELKNLCTYICSPLHSWNPEINVFLPLVFTRHFCLYNRIGHILHRNCLLKNIVEGEIDGRMEVMGRRGSRCNQLLDDLKGSWGYWRLKLDTLDRTMGGTGFAEVYGPLVRLQNEFNDWSAVRMLGELWLGSRLLDKRLSSSPRNPHWCWGPHKLLSKGYWGSSRRVCVGCFKLTPN